MVMELVGYAALLWAIALTQELRLLTAKKKMVRKLSIGTLKATEPSSAGDRNQTGTINPVKTSNQKILDDLDYKSRQF